MKNFKIIKITYFLLGIFFSMNFSYGQNSTPGIDIIGKGYDIFGEYANNRCVKQPPIFDFSKCPLHVQAGYKVPNMMYLSDNSDHLIKEITASSQSDFASSLSVKVNLKCNALVFAGSVNSQFGSEATGSEEKYCHSIMDANTKWKISLESIDNLIPYLKPQFKTELETLEPELLFNKYGTHFIKLAFLGGRIDYYLSSVINNSFSKENIDIAVKARYGIMKGDGSTQTSNAQSSTSQNIDIKTSIVGGNSEFMNNINNLDQYQKWAEGIKANPVLCDFNEESLIPIWELTNDPNRKQKLKNYFENTIVKKHELKEKEQKLELDIDEVMIINSCESAFKDYGEFQLIFYVNGVQKDITKEKRGDEGQPCVFDKKRFVFKAPKQGESVTVKLKLIEVDQTGNDELTMGENPEITINYPLDESILNNVISKDLFKTALGAGKYCQAFIKYHLSKAN